MKWTKKKCKEVALLCKNRNEFGKKYRSAYIACYRNNWLNEICSHMISRKSWNKDDCNKVSLLCKSRNEFSIKYGSTYRIALSNNWLDSICSHMISTKKPMGYWCKEKCKEVALLCKTKKEFCIKYKKAYNLSLKNKWMEEFSKHMIPLGNLKRRLVYACEFDDKSIYIGLTCNSQRRKTEHLNTNTSVTKYVNLTGLKPFYRELTDYIEVNEAINMEKYYVDYFKSNGFNILNRKETGDVGGKDKWNYEKCKKEATNYKSRSEFAKNKRNAYNLSRKEKWLDEFYP